MFCSKCGNEIYADGRFCRKCGDELGVSPLAIAGQAALQKQRSGAILPAAKTKDPDELTGNGIGGVIVGDGFFMVAVILSATHSSVSSLLWLFLLIPAFFFFGKGFADILHARQICRRQKELELNSAPDIAQLPPPRATVAEIIKKSISGELVATSSVTEGTTRELG